MKTRAVDVIDAIERRRTEKQKLADTNRRWLPVLTRFRSSAVDVPLPARTVGADEARLARPIRQAIRRAMEAVRPTASQTARRIRALVHEVGSARREGTSTFARERSGIFACGTS